MPAQEIFKTPHPKSKTTYTHLSTIGKNTPKNDTDE
jgi:hypothetical protein